jgi:3-keto-L-gulonate-6-phosphate decarboxylase
LEAGTPFIKRYGAEGIKQIRSWYQQHLSGMLLPYLSASSIAGQIIKSLEPYQNMSLNNVKQETFPYVVADLKTMDRGQTEVAMAAEACASAAIGLGLAPKETLNSFLDACDHYGLDSMVDMMNVEYPLAILRQLKRPPEVVILHRGVDEERFNREKQIPLHEIQRIKGNYDILISIAGGDTIREVQRSVFNDADIVVIWKSVYQSSSDTVGLVEGFLKEIK